MEKIRASCIYHVEKLEPSKVLPYEITPKLIRAGFSRRAFLAPLGLIVKSSQVNTLPKAKSKTRSKQNKDMALLSTSYGP